MKTEELFEKHSTIAHVSKVTVENEDGIRDLGNKDLAFLGKTAFTQALTEYRESIIAKIDEMIEESKKRYASFPRGGTKNLAEKVSETSRCKALTELKNKIREL